MKQLTWSAGVRVFCLALAISLPQITQAQDAGRETVLRAVQSAVSAANYETAKGWLAKPDGYKMEWWLKGNESRFAGCVGENYMAQLAEWQKDAIWFNQGSLPPGSREITQEAHRRCVEILAKENAHRCKKFGGQFDCGSPK